MERKYTVEKSGGPRAFRNFSAKLSAQGRIDEPLRGANLRRNPMSRRVGSAGESSPSFRSLYRLIKLMDAYYRGCPANGCSSSTSIDPPSPVSASFEIPTLAEGRELIRIRHFDSLVRLGG